MQREEGEMMPNDSMPLTRPDAGYLYANMSYNDTSTLCVKVSWK